ncbi:MAG: FAD-dependent pyridine nucleotide-disulfide oxidoreductase [Myxococcaceae bacterium]|nr:FAD-dependent pyridine nucleotide-disulfide oxidoreductase [Myxococcaceae bacterium]
MSMEEFDVAVIGGGPAGMSAALVLARACRRVAVFDAGEPRNRVSRAVHNFLSRDGIAPAELREISRQQLTAYPNVTFVDSLIADAERERAGFAVVAADGTRARCRKLILATGLVDQLPTIPGMRELYGRGVYSCPYCDGWEVRDTKLVVYARGGAHGVKLALELLGWSRDVVLCTDGPATLDAECSATLERNQIGVRQERVVSLQSEAGSLHQVVFEGGSALATRALFVCADGREASDLAQRLGCEGASATTAETGRHGRVNVPGLFIVGDATREVLQVAVAAGRGCEAAIAVNAELLREDLR